jgi:hypothetical protein
MMTKYSDKMKKDSNKFQQYFKNIGHPIGLVPQTKWIKSKIDNY